MNIAFFGPMDEDVDRLLRQEIARRGYAIVDADADVVFIMVSLSTYRSLGIAAQQGKAYCPILAFESGVGNWILEVMFFTSRRVRTIIDKPTTQARVSAIFDALERGDTSVLME